MNWRNAGSRRKGVTKPHSVKAVRAAAIAPVLPTGHVRLPLTRAPSEGIGAKEPRRDNPILIGSRSWHERHGAAT